MAHRFSAGGGDLVKDDHNLLSTSLTEFENRIALIHREVEAANAASGRACLYLPNLILRDEDLEPACEILLKLGIRGALVSPFCHRDGCALVLWQPNFRSSSWLIPR